MTDHNTREGRSLEVQVCQIDGLVAVARSMVLRRCWWSIGGPCPRRQKYAAISAAGYAARSVAGFSIETRLTRTGVVIGTHPGVRHVTNPCHETEDQAVSDGNGLVSVCSPDGI